MGKLVIWPEGIPDAAKVVRREWAAGFAVFWMGLRTWWPDIRRARRIKSCIVLVDTICPGEIAAMFDDLDAERPASNPMIGPTRTICPIAFSFAIDSRFVLDMTAPI